MPQRRRMQGFTLVEIALTLAIIAALTYMVSFSTRDVKIRAKQLEAKIVLKDLDARYVAYTNERDDFPSVAVMSQNQQTFTTKGGCRVANPLNYQVHDCRKASFSVPSIAGPNRQAVATEISIGDDRRVFSHLESMQECNDTGYVDGNGDPNPGMAVLDQWRIRHGRIWQVQNPATMADCLY